MAPKEPTASEPSHKVAKPPVVDLTEDDEGRTPATIPQGILPLSDEIISQHANLGADRLRWSDGERWKASSKGELHLTPSRVDQIMRAVLPPNSVIEPAARENMTLYAVGYIQLLTSKAANIAPHKLNYAITASNLLQAMEESEFTYYTQALQPLIEAHKAEAEDRRVAAAAVQK